jgi:hypothetical protein
MTSVIPKDGPPGDDLRDRGGSFQNIFAALKKFQVQG